MDMEVYEARGLTFRPGFQSSDVGRGSACKPGNQFEDVMNHSQHAQREGLAGRTDREPRVCCLRSVWSLQPFFPVW